MIFIDPCFLRYLKNINQFFISIWNPYLYTNLDHHNHINSINIKKNITQSRFVMQHSLKGANILDKIMKINFKFKRGIKFLHLSEIVEGLYFHCSLSVSVCMCVCVCVCPALLVNKIQAERMHRFWRGFR